MIKKKIKQIINCVSKLKQFLLLNKLEGKNVIALSTKLRETNIGFGSYIGKKGEVYNTEIGKFTSIGPYFKTIVGLHPMNFVSTHPSFYSIKMQSGFSFVNKQKYSEDIIKTKIGNDVWIGSDVKILGGVIIGDGAIVGAGALVTKNIPPYEVWGGVPAKKMKDRFSDDYKAKLLRIKWWNKRIDWIEKNAKYFDNIEKFIERCDKNGDK